MSHLPDVFFVASPVVHWEKGIIEGKYRLICKICNEEVKNESPIDHLRTKHTADEFYTEYKPMDW
jgi:hypothetical protein